MTAKWAARRPGVISLGLQRWAGRGGHRASVHRGVVEGAGVRRWGVDWPWGLPAPFRLIRGQREWLGCEPKHSPCRRIAWRRRDRLWDQPGIFPTALWTLQGWIKPPHFPSCLVMGSEILPTDKNVPKFLSCVYWVCLRPGPWGSWRVASLLFLHRVNSPVRVTGRQRSHNTRKNEMRLIISFMKEVLREEMGWQSDGKTASQRLVPEAGRTITASSNGMWIQKKVTVFWTPQIFPEVNQVTSVLIGITCWEEEWPVRRLSLLIGC